jgi:AcrR family transcriptional regulator
MRRVRVGASACAGSCKATAWLFWYADPAPICSDVWPGSASSGGQYRSNVIAGGDTDDPGERFEQARMGDVQRLRARRLEIEEAIFARVLDGVFDPTGRGDAEYVAGMREAVAAVVDYGLTGIEQGEESSAVVPSAAVAQARRAARGGVGLDTVLRRYIAGYAVLEDFIMQEADHSVLQGDRTTLQHVLGTSASLLDRLIPSITSAYMQEPEPEPAASSSVPKAHAPAPARRKQSGNSGGSAASHEHLVPEQRVRITQALVGVLAERGFAGATVGRVVRRARVSTRTFYQLFDGLEECLIAIMDTALEEAVTLVSRELQEADCWRDGVRSALATVLSYFDGEPELARVCIVETLAGGPVVLAHRERLIQAFRLPVLQRIEREVTNVPSLAAEGAMSSVLGIMHAHIVTAKPGSFTELLGPLMGLIMAPYLGARGVEREIEHGDELARTILAGASRRAAQSQGQDTRYSGEQGAALPAMLGNPNNRRARECMLFLAEHPDSSNREVAVGIEIAHQSHISRLLAYLLEESLATKRSEGRGKRNAWRLTARGEEIARMLR